MNHYKEPDQVTINEAGRPVLNASDCNVSLGFLEGILNTRDGKALAEIYENYIVSVGSLDVEKAVVEMRRGLV